MYKHLYLPFGTFTLAETNYIKLLLEKCTTLPGMTTSKMYKKYNIDSIKEEQ